MSDALTQDDALLTAIDFVYLRAMAEQLSAVVLLGNQQGGSGGFVVVPEGANQQMRVVGSLAAACMNATPERRAEILDAVAMVLFDPTPASDELSAGEASQG